MPLLRFSAKKLKNFNFLELTLTHKTRLKTQPCGSRLILFGFLMRSHDALAFWGYMVLDDLGIENYFRNLSVFDRSAIVISGRVRELESHFSARWTVHRHFTQTLCAVVRVQALEKKSSLNIKINMLPYVGFR